MYCETVSAPGSTTGPRCQVFEEPSFTTVGPVRSTNGTTFFTVTSNVDDVVALSLSVTVTVTVYTPSSAYVCVPPSVPEPIDSATVAFSVRLPSPQLTVAVCVSSLPGSVNEPSVGLPPVPL